MLIEDSFIFMCSIKTLVVIQWRIEDITEVISDTSGQGKNQLRKALLGAVYPTMDGCVCVCVHGGSVSLKHDCQEM